MKYVLGFMLSCWLSVFSYANTIPIEHWYQIDKNQQVQLTVDLFLSSTCGYCHKADDFFSELEHRYPWLIVHRYLINQDKSAIRYFYNQLKDEQGADFAVPAVFFCNARWTGFSLQKNSGELLLKKIKFCRQQILKDGGLRQSTVHLLQQQGKASQLIAKMDEIPSKTSFIPLLAWTDSFSMASFFCFTSFLCFLFLLPAQTTLRRIGGLIFILSIGMMHFLQQMYPGFYDTLSSGMMLCTIGLGLFLVLFSFKYGFKSSWITIVMGATVLSVLYYYQQIGSTHVSFIFEQWMAEQAVLKPFYYACVLFYQLSYILPLLALLGTLELLGHTQFMQRRQAEYVLFARFFLFYTGVIVLVYPSGLAKIAVFFVVLPVAALSLWFIARKNKAEHV